MPETPVRPTRDSTSPGVTSTHPVTASSPTRSPTRCAPASSHGQDRLPPSASSRSRTRDGNTQWVGNKQGHGVHGTAVAPMRPTTSCGRARQRLHPLLLNAPIAGPGTAHGHARRPALDTAIAGERTPNPRLGDLRYDVLERATAATPRRPLFPACMVTLMWTLTDFTRENGATVFVPAVIYRGVSRTGAVGRSTRKRPPAP